MEESSNNTQAPAESLWRVEAARYALLRRLAFAMRHHMVVHLQPIGMITEVMDRRLKAAEPDLAQVQESMGRINGFSKAAVQSCLDVVSWLAPDGKATIALDAGVAECMALLRSSMAFRGFTVREEVGAGETMLARAALRSVLPAALLTLTDGATAPAVVLVKAQPTAWGAELSLAVEPTEGSPGFAGDAPYRILGWDEVQAIAQAEGVELRREGERVDLSFSTPGSA
jgi:hypothetical protein